MPSPPIYTHPSPRTTLLPHLLPLLPSPLPLIRRLQSHLQTPHAHTLSTFPPSPTSPPPTPFALAYLDRSRAPETECWLYSSLELAPPAHPHPPVSNATSSFPTPASIDADLLHRARTQLLALLAHIARLPLPAEFAGAHPKRLLVGALHQSVLECLTRAPWEGGAEPADAMGGAGVVRGGTQAWRKFLMGPGEGVRAGCGLGLGEGLGLRVTEVGRGRGDWARVMRRLVLVRREGTLRVLPGVAVRKGGEGEGEMVAWGFWGVDGSVTSLHVEEEVRGKGLGKAVTARLLEMLVEGQWEAGGEDGEERTWKGFIGLTREQAWAHMDVGEKNAASIAVAEGLGGTRAWLVFWTWMDLERAVKELEEMS